MSGRKAIIQPPSGLAIAALALSIAALPQVVPAKTSQPLSFPNAELEPMPFKVLDGWQRDDQAEAFRTFLQSCRAILKSTKAMRAGRPLYSALYDVCQRAQAAGPLDAAAARAFFEQNFRGYRISPLGEPNGFFTGYYEPIVEGSRFPSNEYSVPVYRRPPNLIIARLRGKMGSKGRHAFRKIQKIPPYLDRGQIEEGALAGRDLEICWMKDPIDAFFAQIQGSTRVRLDTGATIRLNYDATNGHPYTAVGKFLIERGIVSREEMSMQRIRDWMEANPEDGKELRRQNKSFVFFREINLPQEFEPPGAQGIPLTVGRSLAVDKNIHVYGTPFFVDAELPIQSEKARDHFSRLMIAQDTGGAIVGPARADLYFGAGDEAARVAGRLKHFGRFVMLIPKELDPAVVAKSAPLPRPRPAIKDEPAEKTLGPMEPAKTKTAAQRVSEDVPLPKTRPSRP
jgi:membrane-bound lytic murein transglycosylase A